MAKRWEGQTTIYKTLHKKYKDRGTRTWPKKKQNATVCYKMANSTCPTVVKCNL